MTLMGLLKSLMRCILYADKEMEDLSVCDFSGR